VQPDGSVSEKPKVKTVQKENQASSTSSDTALLGTVGQHRDILRVDLRVGRIVSAEKHPDADSLVNLSRHNILDCNSVLLVVSY
jgi:tRNA-binding EMAP/Myf-like protein